jgi:hypothetical protein
MVIEWDVGCPTRQTIRRRRYAGIDPATKKQRQKWFGGLKTRREAEQFRLALASALADVFSGSGPVWSSAAPHRRRPQHLAQQGVALGTLRDRTAKCTEALIRLYLTPNIGHIPLVRLSPRPFNSPM